MTECEAVRRVELLIFDLDGTLADTRADLTAAVNHALKELALPPLSMDQVCRYVGDGLQTLLSRALGLHHGDLVENVVRLFRDYYGLHLLDRTRLYCGDSTVQRKPHPEPALKVLTLTGVDPRLAAMVGDSPADIEMAQQAGVFSVGVTYGLRSAAEVRAAGPDLLLESLAELRHHLR